MFVPESMNAPFLESNAARIAAAKSSSSSGSLSTSRLILLLGLSCPPLLIAFIRSFLAFGFVDSSCVDLGGIGGGGTPDC